MNLSEMSVNELRKLIHDATIEIEKKVAQAGLDFIKTNPINTAEKVLAARCSSLKAVKAYRERTGAALSVAFSVIDEYRATLHLT